MPAVLDPNCWATLADLKEHIDIDPNDTTKDNFLINRLNGAFASVKNYIGRDLNVNTYTEDYDGDGTATTVVRNWPIITLISLYDDLFRTWQTSPFTPDPTTLLDPTTYYFDSITGVITVFQGVSAFRSGNGNVHVIYTAGYSTIPYDAKTGLLEWAAWYASRAGTEGRVAETMGGRSQQYEHDIPEYIKQNLRPYKSYAV